MALNNIDFTKDRYKEQLAALEAARLAKGLTYAELAEQLGVSKIFIASTLDGQQILPAATAEKLADIHPVVWSLDACIGSCQYNRPMKEGVRPIKSGIEGMHIHSLVQGKANPVTIIPFS